METEVLTVENREDILVRVEALIRAGGVAAVPTDTVYGFVADAGNEEAVKKIFAIKKRPHEKALPIFVKDIAAARRYAYISDAKTRFLEKIWPGPVTVVFHHKEKLPAVLTGEQDTIGIRIPDHTFILALLARCEMPLAQTSANISAQPPAKTAAETSAYFENEDNQPNLVVDGGPLAGTSSTVIMFTGTEPIIHRTGIVSKEDLDALFILNR